MLLFWWSYLPPIYSTQVSDLHLTYSTTDHLRPQNYYHFEYTRSSSTTVTMDPEDVNSRPGRTYHQQHHPQLTCLPLYVSDSFGRHLLQQYHPECHTKCIQMGRKPPMYFVPLESWWHEQARSILAKIKTDGHMLTHCKCIRSALLVLLNEHITDSLGGAIPHLPSQSEETRSRRGRAILLSALTIEFVRWGIDQDSISLAKHIELLALTSYQLASSTNRGHEPFANTAVDSAHKAIKYFSSNISSRIKDEKIQREREERMERAKQASQGIWHRHYAACTIQRTVIRFCFIKRLRERVRIRFLCRGASTHAKTVKAQRPPSPQATKLAPLHPAPPSKPNHLKHPFCDRGLPLPKRKRRQRNRRPRMRPPQHCRSAAYTDATTNDPSIIASSTYPPVPSTDRIMHYHNRPPTLPSQPLPLCFWSAQTTAAVQDPTIGLPSTIKLPTLRLPTDAAQTIQQLYRRWHHTKQQHSSAQTIQHLYHRWHQTKIQHSSVTTLQTWYRRTHRRIFFQQCSNALSFKRKEAWLRYALDTVEEFYQVHHNLDIYADTAWQDTQSTILQIIEQSFPGIKSPYNLESSYNMQALALLTTAAEFAKMSRWDDKTGARPFLPPHSALQMVHEMIQYAEDSIFYIHLKLRARLNDAHIWQEFAAKHEYNTTLQYFLDKGIPVPSLSLLPLSLKPTLAMTLSYLDYQIMQSNHAI